MSLEEIAQEIEREPEGSSSNAQTLHIHATKELLEIYREHEVKGKDGKVEKVRQLEVAGRTELPSPNAMAVLETVKDWFDEEFGVGTNTDLESFIRNYKVDMIDKERKSRTEAVGVLMATGYQQGANSDQNLQKLITQS